MVAVYIALALWHRKLVILQGLGNRTPNDLLRGNEPRRSWPARQFCHSQHDCAVLRSSQKSLRRSAPSLACPSFPWTQLRTNQKWKRQNFMVNQSEMYCSLPNPEHVLISVISMHFMTISGTFLCNKVTEVGYVY